MAEETFSDPLYNLDIAISPYVDCFTLLSVIPRSDSKYAVKPDRWRIELQAGCQKQTVAGDSREIAVARYEIQNDGDAFPWYGITVFPGI
jgi:hypothetical protein